MTFQLKNKNNNNKNNCNFVVAFQTARIKREYV